MQDLITFLHADGLITRNESIAIKRAANDLHENPVRIIRSLNIASPRDIQKCFKIYFNYSLVTDALVDNLTGEYASLVPIDLAIHFSVFGFGDEDGKLYVGMEDPSDKRTLEALKFFLGKEIIASAANIYQLSKAMEKLYGLSEEISGLETILDKARGAGAWSQKERLLFEKIIEERNMREQEEASAVTYVSSKAAARAAESRQKRNASPKKALSLSHSVDESPLTAHPVKERITETRGESSLSPTPPVTLVSQDVLAAAPAAAADLMSEIEGIDASELPDLDAIEFDFDNPADDFSINEAEPGGNELNATNLDAGIQSSLPEAGELEALELEAVKLESGDLDDLALDDGVVQNIVLEDLPPNFAEADLSADFAEGETPGDSSRRFEILPDRAELGRLVQKCTLKALVARDLQQALQAANAIFAAAAEQAATETAVSKKNALGNIIFYEHKELGVGVSYDGLTLSSSLLEDEPWSALGPLIKALNKKVAA